MNRVKTLTGYLAGLVVVCIVLTFLASCSVFDETQLSDSLLQGRQFDTPVSEASFVPPEPEPEVVVLRYEGDLELPVVGATGYAALGLDTYTSADYYANYVTTLSPGQGFTILEEQGDWWQIDISGVVAWVPHRQCMINLPDVIPSIVYDNANSYSSKFISSGRAIPNITGLQLYNSLSFNERFQEETYQVPVLYAMSKKIHVAQQLALAQGNTLVINEGFRPYDVQQMVYTNLSALASADSEVMAGITRQPWSIGWFIAAGVSNHQQGYAIDTTLGVVHTIEERVCGNYAYTKVTLYEEYTMPTPIHELSAASVSLAGPVNSESASAWYSVGTAASMNEAALALQSYCANAGLTPLASEWWHFGDLSMLDRVSGMDGRYYISYNGSRAPVG